MNFVTGAILQETSDGLGFIETSSHPPVSAPTPGKSLYDQIQSNSKLEHDAFADRCVYVDISDPFSSRNKPPREYDEEEIQFLREYEDQVEDAMVQRRKQEMMDKDEFEKKIMERVVKKAKEEKEKEEKEMIAKQTNEKTLVGHAWKLKPAVVKVRAKEIGKKRKGDDEIGDSEKKLVKKFDDTAGLSLLEGYDEE